MTGLTPAHYQGLCLAYFYLLAAGWHLFVRQEKVDRWVCIASQTRGALALSEAQRQALLQQAGWVTAAASHPWPWARCLQRSLALCFWMERQGVRPELKIGVRKEGYSLTAHAWVEYQGQVLNDRPEVRTWFTPLANASSGMALEMVGEKEHL